MLYAKFPIPQTPHSPYYTGVKPHPQIHSHQHWKTPLTMLCSSLCRSPTPPPTYSHQHSKTPLTMLCYHYAGVSTPPPTHSRWHTKTPLTMLCQSLYMYVEVLPHPKSTPTHTQRPHSPCYAISMQQSPPQPSTHSHQHSKTPLTMLFSSLCKSPHPIPIPLPPTVKGFLDNSPLGTIPHQIKLKPTYWPPGPLSLG